MPASQSLQAVFTLAWKEATVLKEDHAGTEHLMLALLQSPELSPAFSTAAVTYAHLKSCLLLNRANNHILSKKYPLALLDFHASLKEFPENRDAHNGLAWFLLTGPDPSLRNPPLALEHAQTACRGLTKPNPIYLDTLAAALTETGNLEQAAIVKKRIEALATK